MKPVTRITSEASGNRQFYASICLGRVWKLQSSKTAANKSLKVLCSKIETVPKASSGRPRNLNSNDNNYGYTDQDPAIWVPPIQIRISLT